MATLINANRARLLAIKYTKSERKRLIRAGACCLLCGRGEPDVELTLDHFPVEFSELREDFMRVHSAKAVAAMTQSDYEAKWVDFHAEFAVYRVLCFACNNREGEVHNQKLERKRRFAALAASKPIKLKPKYDKRGIRITERKIYSKGKIKIV